jgi:hypothetical protein
MNSWVSKWIKETYPRAKSDLCTCFFDRSQSLADKWGYIGMITASSWMFISSFEKFRKALLATGSICSMIQQSTHGYAGVTVPTTMFVYACNRSGITGSYIRLTDFDRPQWQEPRALEALADPDCGWFYRRNANSFCAIPGSPIAYWTGDALLAVFRQGIPLGDICDVRKGVTTSDNDRFLHYWWEVSHDKERFECRSVKESVESGAKWFPCNKGGEFRKWYGNNDYVINWENDGYEIRNFRDEHGKLLSVPRNTQYLFLPAVTWSAISSDEIAFRYKPSGHVINAAGPSLFGDDGTLLYLQGAMNSSVSRLTASILSPTLNFEVGQVASYPVIPNGSEQGQVSTIVNELRFLSKDDWDSFESSWDFKRHPLA